MVLHTATLTHRGGDSLVGEALQCVGAQIVLIQHDMVVHWPGCALDGGMGIEVEVVFCRVHNPIVHHSSCSIYTSSLGTFQQLHHPQIGQSTSDQAHIM